MEEGRDEKRWVSVYPANPSPGSLQVLVPEDRREELDTLQREAAVRVWEVRGVPSDHIPLSGLGGLTEHPQHRLFLNESPLTIYLHRGGKRAVYFDLVGDDAKRRLEYIAVKVKTSLPSNAFLLAREPLNRLLDALARGHKLPLIYQRLDLVSPRDGNMLAHELVLPPAPGGILLGPLGGIHQAEAFAPYDAILREALTNPSPFYKLLCAFRLYEGTNVIRRWLRKEAQRLDVDVSLPRDPAIAAGDLEAMGLPTELAAGIQKANELFAKMRDARNAIAHFLFEGEEGREGHLYLADGVAFQHYSVGATVLLRYASQALDDLRSFYSQHLESRHLVGSILPMPQHRDRFIVVDPNVDDEG
jgi:hypothetical protein